MKKIILIGLTALITLSLITCIDAPNGAKDDDVVGYTDFVMAKDGRSLTLYLDGVGVPETRAQRALNREMALLNHNFFEVVFIGFNGSANVTARTSWGLGEAAGIRGIYRAGDGIDYGGVDPATATLTAPSSGTPGVGAAILFVGRRSDKTLLAVGKLTGVDDVGAGTFAANAVVTPGTKAVQFTIVALSSGVAKEGDNSGTPTGLPATGAGVINSFLTANGSLTNVADADEVLTANTNMGTTTINAKYFPFFILSPGKTSIKAQYKFETTTTTMSSYIAGIIAGTPTAEFGVIQINDNGSIYEVDGPIAEGIPTAISATLAEDASSDPINNIIEFDFNTSAVTSNGYRAMQFRIPVRPLVNTATEIQWFLRPGFGSNVINLDNGEVSYGGAVLLCVTNIDTQTLPISVKN